MFDSLSRVVHEIHFTLYLDIRGDMVGETKAALKVVRTRQKLVPIIIIIIIIII